MEFVDWTCDQGLHKFVPYFVYVSLTIVGDKNGFCCGTMK